MSMTRVGPGERRGGFQRLFCAMGVHAFEQVGIRTNVGHRFSEAHETLYEVHSERELLRCEHCGVERVRRGRSEEFEVGHYERTFVRMGP